MVIVLEKNIRDDDKRRIRTFLEKNSLRVNEIAGEEETIFGAVGKVGIDPREVEILPGVKQVIPISKPYKMASREFKRDNTIVNVRGVKVGGNRVTVIAGPCAVESREQIMESAARVAESGAVMLRGGAYKPRTSPYAFQGMGEEGVKILREAGDAYGLPVVTEIVSAEHIPAMLDYVDVYQIGARNMQNFELLKKVGALGKPVILKRGLSATIEEWLMAAEYLLASGTEDVILCERGIRTYEKATRNTLDLSAIPILRSLTHLPIIVDPSHAVGIRDKVPPMGLAAIAAGADGLIVEVHPNPDCAMSDGAQSLYPEQFEKMMRDIEVLAPVVGRSVSRRVVPVSAGSAALKSGVPSAEGVTLEAAIKRSGPVVCACAGGRGAYAEQAMSRYFDGEATSLAVTNFREVINAVLDGRAAFGMLPIENSLAGSVYENYDNLTRSEDIEIVGSATLRIEHSLLAPKGASLETIESVYSHPQGLAQCDAFLAKYPRWKHIETESTSGAAEFVAASGDVTKAAIGSEANAAIYRLESLKSGIETNPRNYTRFVVIARAGEIVCASPNHASVIFSTANEPGALYAALGFFMKHGLNLTKLESRPIQGEPWRYRFYANVSLPEGVSSSVVAGESIRAALAEMGKISQDNGIVQGVRVLGLYNSKELQ
ncbi:MAG TPA: 3-deoxy-7-phosphoheptulonate synthase [Treponemataceae bacterium]|nr:3-deoxy-7-phosphoheptulonate synthase [Treponemataceae bacterium]